MLRDPKDDLFFATKINWKQISPVWRSPRHLAGNNWLLNGMTGEICAINTSRISKKSESKKWLKTDRSAKLQTHPAHQIHNLYVIYAVKPANLKLVWFLIKEAIQPLTWLNQLKIREPVRSATRCAKTSVAWWCTKEYTTDNIFPTEPTTKTIQRKWRQTSDGRSTEARTSYIEHDGASTMYTYVYMYYFKTDYSHMSLQSVSPARDRQKTN